MWKQITSFFRFSTPSPIGIGDSEPNKSPKVSSRSSQNTQQITGETKPLSQRNLLIAQEQEEVIQNEKRKNFEELQDNPDSIDSHPDEQQRAHSQFSVPSLLAFSICALLKDLDLFLKRPDTPNNLQSLLNRFSILGNTFSPSLIKASIRLKVRQHELSSEQRLEHRNVFSASDRLRKFHFLSQNYEAYRSYYLLTELALASTDEPRSLESFSKAILQIASVEQLTLEQWRISFSELMLEVLINPDAFTEKRNEDPVPFSKKISQAGELIVQLKRRSLLSQALPYLDNNQLGELPTFLTHAAIPLSTQTKDTSAYETLQSIIPDIQAEWARRSTLYSQHVNLLADMLAFFEKHQATNLPEQNKAIVKEIGLAYRYALELQTEYGPYSAFYLRLIAGHAPPKTPIDDAFAQDFEENYLPQLPPEDKAKAFAFAKIAAASTKLTLLKADILKLIKNDDYRRIFERVL